MHDHEAKMCWIPIELVHKSSENLPMLFDILVKQTSFNINSREGGILSLYKLHLIATLTKYVTIIYYDDFGIFQS